MKVYQVQVDTITLTLIVDNESELFPALEAHDSSFEQEKNSILYDFGSSKEECLVTDISTKRGVVHAESH